jgi:hypothetical protein
MRNPFRYNPTYWIKTGFLLMLIGIAILIINWTSDAPVYTGFIFGRVFGGYTLLIIGALTVAVGYYYKKK